MSWHRARSAETFAPIGQRENHRLDVYLAGGEVADVRLDGKSVWPTWFKLEWKGTGEMSAKIQGFRLATRYGDAITIHQDRP